MLISFWLMEWCKGNKFYLPNSSARESFVKQHVLELDENNLIIKESQWG
jgi:hypothetical protein